MSSYVKTQHPEYGEVARKKCPNSSYRCRYTEVIEFSSKTTKTYFECYKSENSGL
jgi:hypothetical protein